VRRPGACTADIHDDGSWTYDETSTITHAKMAGEALAHVDRNRMHRCS
jgi:hypothetical protein